jgi:Putative transposase/Transposase zinc-binding domain
VAPSSPAQVAAAGAAAGAPRPAFEVADVVRASGLSYVRTHPTTTAQRRVLHAIAACRTAALGGHVEGCDACGHRRIAYNSCRNRHCPKCQGKETARWMAAEQALLLPVPYFHLVFTLPHRLNALVRVNRRRLCALLFHAAAETLRTFARDPHHLGAEPAITMVLHTWGQTLREHFHIHCVVSGGGLALDESAWISLPKGKKNPRRPFLFPVAALSEVFRGKYIAALTRARSHGELRFVGQSAALADPVPWQELLDALTAHPWVVYCKRPFAGPAAVLKYLSRYTHRVAISNQRLLYVGNGVVRFAYRDYADHDQPKDMTVAATEFLRRFLLHLVPKGLMRIRHYGLTANSQRAHKLQRCRELFGITPPPTTDSLPTQPPPEADSVRRLTDTSAKPCPKCGAPLRIIEILPARRSDRLLPATPPDTS